MKAGLFQFFPETFPGFAKKALAKKESKTIVVSDILIHQKKHKQKSVKQQSNITKEFL
jgi:hypothetical protein